MVSGGLTGEREKARYRRRKPIPAIVIVILLGLAAVFVWSKVIAKASDVDAAVACPPAATGTQSAKTGGSAAKDEKKTKTSTTLPYDGLDKIAPEPAADVKVQVFNASAQRGAATQASNELTQAGLQVAAPQNDPLYPKQNMACRGQIRFGANGESAARTVSLLVPCTQLIRDNRQDATVDLAIGKDFTGVAPNSQAQQAMHELAAWAKKHPAPRGGQQAQAAVLPKLSESLLSEAHSTEC